MASRTVALLIALMLGATSSMCAATNPGTSSHISAANNLAAAGNTAALRTSPASKTTAPRRVPLQYALARLQRDGLSIIYSTDLAPPTLMIEITAITLAEVQAALPALGLTLQHKGESWLLVPDAARSSTEPPGTAIQFLSNAGNPPRRAHAFANGQTLLLRLDDKARCQLPWSKGTRVTVRAEGYQPKTIDLETAEQQVLLEPKLAIETMIVTGTLHRLAERFVSGTHNSMTAADIDIVPSLGGDALRATTHLPGTSSVGVSAKPHIRGGRQDEVLVLLDGVEIPDAFHLADYQSVFSTIDDQSVANVDVYSGGFPARYGNRMSGVIDIDTHATEEHATSRIGISVLSLLANTRGETASGDFAWLVSARRGNLDVVAEHISPKRGRPHYYDALARTDFAITPATRGFAGGFLAQDDVVLKLPGDTAESHIAGRYLWAGFSTQYSDTLSSRSAATFQSSTRRKELSGFDVIDLVRRLHYLQHTRKLDARIDFSYTNGATNMEFGGQIDHGKADYDSHSFFMRDELGQLLGLPADETHDINTKFSGFSGGLYWSGEFAVSPELTIQPGLRWDTQNYYGRDRDATHQVSPRLGLRFEISDAWSLHADAGRFYQPQALQELQATDGESTFQVPQRADHIIVGATWRPNDDWRMHLEAYEKRYVHPKVRFENLFNPFQLLGEVETDRVRIAPRRARARGVDFEVRHQFSDNWSSSLGYSYLDARDLLDNTWVQRRWSQRHTVNAITSWRAENFTASVALTWHSGWRSAQPPETIAADGQLELSSLFNNSIVPDYLSLDIAASRTWRFERTSVTLSADIINVLNRHNTADYDYNIEETDGQLRFLSDRDNLFPLVPSIGVLIAF